MMDMDDELKEKLLEQLIDKLSSHPMSLDKSMGDDEEESEDEPSLPLSEKAGLPDSEDEEDEDGKPKKVSIEILKIGKKPR